jgi:hypothetical protein
LQFAWDSSCKIIRTAPQQDGMGDEPTFVDNVKNIKFYDECWPMKNKFSCENK